jgi:hypothetical protein
MAGSKGEERSQTRPEEKRACAFAQQDEARDCDRDRAVECDVYTDDPLDWHLISKWVGAEEGTITNDYRRKFWMMPSVDHDFTDPTKPTFHICSWRMNDSKNDQTLQEFLEPAAKAPGETLKHRELKNL